MMPNGDEKFVNLSAAMPFFTNSEIFALFSMIRTSFIKVPGSVNDFAYFWGFTSKGEMSSKVRVQNSGDPNISAFRNSLLCRFSSDKGSKYVLNMR